MKTKEIEKTDEYLDVNSKQKKLLNVQLTVIPIVAGALGTFSQRFRKKTGGIGNQTILTTAF